MAEEQPELPGIPGAPEPPPFIHWVMWLFHIAFGDPAMIKKSWRAIFSLAVLLSAGAWYWDQSRYSDRIGNLESADKLAQGTIKSQEIGAQNQSTTIVNLDNTIAQLQEQLKGTSPQLAAIQASRDHIRKQLQQFYISESNLFNRVVANNDDVKKLNDETMALSNIIAEWVVKNMGDAAVAKIFDPGSGIGVNWWRAFNQEHVNILNYIVMIRRNLSDLIESAAWDGSVKSGDNKVP